MTRRIMVLGGTGFLGSHICDAFHAAGCAVVSVSRNGTAGPVRQVRLDLARAGVADLGALLAEAVPDVVVNAAGLAARATERQLRAINTEFVERLVVAVDAMPCRTRLIQIGSSHEYGPDAPGATTAESHPPAPLSLYGKTKLDGTRATLRARRADAVVLRVTNVAGPRARADTLPAIVARRLATIAASGYGNRPAELRLAPLRTWRDYVDVRDVAEAVLAAASAPAVTVAGQVINIASGSAVPVRTLVQRLIALGGLPVRLVEEPASSLPREPMAWQRLDVSRARDLLGWRAGRGLDESLADLLAAVWPPEPDRIGAPALTQP
jgi:nucleoside-diphosphate-sugar epimerase